MAQISLIPIENCSIFDCEDDCEHDCEHEIVGRTFLNRVLLVILMIESRRTAMHTTLGRGLVGLLAGVVVALLPAATAAETFLVRNGRPMGQIVIAEKPTRMARLAASELKAHIEKITGATLPITTTVTESIPVCVYVGRSPHTDRLDVTNDDLKHGAYRMVSGTNWLALIGSDQEFEPVEPWARSRTNGSGGRRERRRIDHEWDKITGETYSNPFHYVYPYWSEELQVWAFDDAGALNAVCDFLRELGVRWYYPGELGEIVPKATDIALPTVNRVVRPEFALRKLGWWSRHAGMTTDEILWCLRLGTNEGADIIGLTQLCHGSKFVHLREEFKEAHPEYFALRNGRRATDHKRGQGAPCLSSEAFFQHHLKYARAVFDHYNEPLISIDVVDGYSVGVCGCELCKGKGRPELGWDGHVSDYVLGYVNRVALELHKSHPGKMVSALAYGGYKLPPTSIDAFSPNLALLMCQSRRMFYDPQAREKTRQLREDWLEKLPSKQLFTYEHYQTSRPGGAWEGIPVYFPHLISEDLRTLKGVIAGEFIELYQPSDPSKLPYDYLAISHLNIYVTTRLWWDPDRDVEALLEEYYRTFYGPACNEMKAFIEYSEQNWHRMRNDVGTIDKALELVATARIAAGDGVYSNRVARIAGYVEPLKRLRAQLTDPRDDVPVARALPRNVRDLKLDGKLDEKLWSTVRKYQLREIRTGGRPAHRTTFRIAWIGDALCLGITCQDSDMEHLSVGTTQKDDPNIWFGDVVEILIETQFHAYYQIAISPSGAVTDLDREKRLDTLWDSGADVATHHGPDGWTIEVRLPAAGENAKDIDAHNGIAGRRPSETYPWFVNVCRQRVRDEQTELTAWSPTGKPRFNVPKKFGKVYAK